MENKQTKRIGTRLAVFGCALALVTMAGVGMTFAKYTKTDSNTQTATVSNFGVTLDVTGDLFSYSYDAEQTYKKDFSGTDISISVRDAATAGDTSTKMVAPGTSGSKTYTATLNNNQVAVNIGFDLTVTLTGWELSTGVAYEPITWTLTKSDGTTTKYYDGSTSTWITLTSGSTAANLTAAQITAATTADNFAPNQSSTTITYTLSWAWAFDNHANTAGYKVTTAYTGHSLGEIISTTAYNALNDSDKGNYTAINGDEADTILGEASSKATISVVGTLTATQID